MCGICGVAVRSPDEVVAPELLDRMTRLVEHRGPDSEGYYRAPGIGFGVRRLAINDLEHGDQPISNEDGSITVVCNGEIYNFVELRQELLARGHRFRSASDVEVIVHLYEDYGVECLQRLRGMFGFALWDSTRRRLMLARDRLGIKPLHYALLPDGCYFGSELKSILASGAVDRAINPRAFRELLEIGFVLTPNTLFRSIQRVPPGHYLLYQEGRVSLHQYWDIAFPRRGEEERLSAETWAELLRDKLRESVAMHSRADVPIGAWLSPGIDSSAIVAFMSDAATEPVQSFTARFDDPSSDEAAQSPTLDRYPGQSVVSQRVECRDDSLKLLPRVIWHQEDMVATGIPIVMLLLAEATKPRFKVVLTGEGSDELLAGYRSFRLDRAMNRLSWLPLALRRVIRAGTTRLGCWPYASRLLTVPSQMRFERYRRLVAFAPGDCPTDIFTPELLERMPAGDELEPSLTLPSDFERWHRLSQMQYFDLKVRMPSFIVQMLDRSSMAHSVEARVPFLDHQVVELCARIPAELKLHGGREKYVLRLAMQGHLPPEITWRKKRGLMAPIGKWMRGPRPEFATELLSEQAIRRKGYFNPAAVKELLAETGRGDRRRMLTAIGVLMIQVWDELFRGSSSLELPSWAREGSGTDHQTLAGQAHGAAGVVTS